MRPRRDQVLTGLLAAAMIWVSASALFGQSGLVHWMSLRRERERLADETLRLTRETGDLERAIAELAEDAGLEAVAREQLGLVRPDEIVYRFKRPPAAPD